MSDTVIKVENLSKSYLIRHQGGERYTALRDVLANGVKGMGNRLVGRAAATRNSQFATQEEFWALNDVSFEVKQGERVGIIGRNGAGKSTLLKILSRITEPTKGRVHIKGRVASLLEVGTGFHPELTGRENIYLNGAILGMGREEIRRKFDEIVAFAEVENFLDTPVKRYSSGMYVRLAFAVAAHLEPEILVVDEVLAVGDAAFQKKCLGKMGEMSKVGRTVLFVSHNMMAVNQFCNSAILLSRGTIKYADQNVSSVIHKYISVNQDPSLSNRWVNNGKEFQNSWFTPLELYISDESREQQRALVSNNDEIWVNVIANISVIDPALTVGYAIYSQQGYPLYHSYQTDETEINWPPLSKGTNHLRSCIPKRFLNEGIYRVELIGGLYYREWLFKPGSCVPSIYFEIQGGLSDSPLWLEKREGLIAPMMHWVSIPIKK